MIKWLRRRYWRLKNTLRRIPNQVRWRYQRMQYGLAENDAWDLDTHLARIIVRGMGHIAPKLEGDDSQAAQDWRTVRDYFARYVDEGIYLATEEAQRTHQEAFQAFARIYNSLWW